MKLLVIIFENPEQLSHFSSVPPSDLRATLNKAGERQCLKWYALFYSTCFTEVPVLGLCHLQMTLYILIWSNSHPFAFWFMVSIFKSWWSGIFAHLFHSSLQPADLMRSVHTHIYMLVFLPPLHPCTHKDPQHMCAACGASSLLCGGATTSRVQCSLVIQGLRLLRATSCICDQYQTALHHFNSSSGLCTTSVLGAEHTPQQLPL